MHKVLKNKYILLLLLLIDILVLFFLFYHNILLGILFVLVQCFVFILIFKIHFGINFLNIDKIRNLCLSQKIRKKIDDDERYLEKMEIKTFDGSGGTTHPCIIYFENGFNGYKYWIVHTPYDDNNVELENPSIAVSNDGINFIIPDGISNPLLPIIKQKGKVLKYYNDNFFLYDNNMLQVWYRYTEEDKTKEESVLVNKIYRIVSKDGINYSKPELMIDNDGMWYLSPSIIKINDIYYMYYFDKDLKCHCKTSNDLKKWSLPNKINVVGYNGNFWHGEVKLINKKIYLLFLSKNYELYLAESNIDTPFSFKKNHLLDLKYYDQISIYGNAKKYKSTFLINENYIKLYIPYKVDTINWFKIKKVKHIKWTMTNTIMKHDNFIKYIEKNIDKNE